MGEPRETTTVRREKSGCGRRFSNLVSIRPSLPTGGRETPVKPPLMGPQGIERE